MRRAPRAASSAARRRRGCRSRWRCGPWRRTRPCAPSTGAARSASSLRLAHRARAGGHAVRVDLGGAAVHARLRPVELGQEHGAGVERQAQVHVRLDGDDREVIDHLERRRHDARGDDRGDGAAGVLDVVEDDEERAHGLGPRRERDDELGHHGEGALRADRQAREVEPGQVERAAAGGDDRAVGQDQRHAAHVLVRLAVLEAVRPARVGRRVAPQRRGHLAGRIGRVEQAVGLDPRRQLDVHDPGLDDGEAVLDVDLEDRVHARGDEQDAALLGQGAAGQAGPGAAGGHGHPARVGQAQHRGHVLRSAGEDDDIGRIFRDGEAVDVVRQPGVLAGEDRVGADRGLERAGQLRALGGAGDRAIPLRRWGVHDPKLTHDSGGR